ncbi:carboxylesterase family protein [Stenotrophomonas sp. TWI169]|jgi:para-nitrobenzyl esterase|uniref:carboxylesterase/lipase family protein n=1 Tax=Stenotrophomonas TaxID=40323 RepID=UPI001009A82D|nr:MULTISPECIES: carboxylesterase family protein [Stenotrophomonas]MBH1665295.1 carboxylesterase/lipase family protein [Stenotrophomonas maltophilia]MCU1021999.1 carboxylesterase/lipase family protein [Stenotrophomonas maltophilia]MCU1092144.1 carboxylesterase/lipase family protein [Stenotrophomonas maltophilia]RXK70871.1 carboxylesterase/lipase family protein [Stenotrophomonas sp. MA5]HEL3863928.1 carboxylesterase/lipase family protein [Stenotrophomonas maltophilia]
MNDAPADLQRRRFLRDSARWALATASATAAFTALPTLASVPGVRDDRLPLARVRGGRVRGQREHGVLVFRGLRYGADTARHRFQPPRHEAAWRGIADALEYGPAAPQGGSEGPGSEDCLFLNVWTPALGDGGRRPVLVYVHGGGFNNGSGSDPLYDGAALCRRGDVVVVTLNHRLNTFGYLYLGALGDPRYAASGNVGQLDLVQALQWVRQHAAVFGGDAANITVFGQSGGGAKIATLMAMPAARGLFQRAWTMSGQQVTAAGPRAAAQRAAIAMQAVAARDVQALLDLPVDVLLEATRARDPSRVESTSLYFGPVLDDVVLPVHPFWPQAPQQSAAIPMVIGNTRDETRAFLGNDPANFALTWETLPAQLERQQFVDLRPETVIAEYRRLYPHYTPSEVFFAATTAGRSWRGAVEELEARARQPAGAAPTWAYQLDWGSPVEEGRLRAFHTLDIPLVFDNAGLPGARTGGGDDARALAATMSEALIAFARSGDPNHAGLSQWAPYTLPQRRTMLFDRTSRAVDDPRAGERALYGKVPFVQRGTQ